MTVKRVVGQNMIVQRVVGQNMTIKRIVLATGAHIVYMFIRIFNNVKFMI